MFREAIDNRLRHLRRPRPQPRRRLRESTSDTPRRVHADRYAVLDNARFVLIALVVVGHLLEQLADAGPVAAAAYRWIYLFHMPAFALVSGAVSKPRLTRHRMFALLTGLLLPYVLFQTLYPAWDAWLFHTGDWSQGYLTPYWLLWYLLSLVCWRLLLPVFTRIRFALPVALVIALAAGAVPWIGYRFSLSRTLVFFPLFLLGHQLGGRRLQKLGAGHARKVAAAAVLAAAAVMAWLLRDLNPEWLYAALGYRALHAAPLVGAATRLALLLAAASCALAVLALVPRQALRSGAGRRSLTVYLTHGFLVRGLVAGGVFAWLAHALAPPVELVLCAAGGVAIAWLLATRGAEWVATPLVRPVRVIRAVVGRRK